jgi:thiol-disulfide isomerase/thioredoxin
MRFSSFLIVVILNLNAANATQTFALPALNQEKDIELGEYRGKTILLDFWASWCAPCLRSLPLYQQWHDEGEIVVVSVNVDDHSQDALAMINKLKLRFPVAFDEEKEVAKSFNVFALPVVFIIDQEGKAVFRHEGFTADDTVKLLTIIKKFAQPQL